LERAVRTLPLALCLAGALAVGGCEEGEPPLLTAASGEDAGVAEEPAPVDGAADGDSSGVILGRPAVTPPTLGTSTTPRDAGVEDVAVGGPFDAGTDGAFLEAGTGGVLQDAGVADVALLSSSDMCGRINCDCTLRGVRLWGNVAYVLAGGDFKIRATLDPDLFVQQSFAPTGCGEWAEVTQPQAADLTVEFVGTGEDFQIEFAAVPGVAKPPGAP
jgi:hypothetical protein